MLTACAGSLPVQSADPVVETRTITRTFCPEELRLPVAGKPDPEAGAVVQGNASGLAFVARLGAWGQSLADRLTDAAAQCPATAGAAQ